MPSLLIVSRVDVLEGADNGEFKGDMEGISFTVSKAGGEKCERCWVYSDYVGKDSKHLTLCERCCGVVE